MLDFLSKLNLNASSIMTIIIGGLLAVLWRKDQTQKAAESELSFQKTKEKLRTFQDQVDLNNKKEQELELTKKSINDTIKSEQHKDVSDVEVSKFLTDRNTDK